MISISFLLPVAIAFGAAFALAILVTGVKASRIRLKSMRTEPVDLARVPQEVRAVLDIGRDWLRQRGFRYLSSWKLRPMIAKATEWKYSDVYAGDDGTTFAVVSPREQPKPGDIVAIEFQSVFADGVVMSTFNRYRHALVWEPPGWKISDDCVADLSHALENHRRRVRGCGATPLAEPAERDRISNARAAGFVDALVAGGQAHRVSGGEARLRFLPALGYAIKLMRGNARAGKVKIVPLQAPTASQAQANNAVRGGEDAGVGADMHSYFTRRATSASATRTGKWRLGVASAVAFVALGAFLWDPVFALILLGVIAFHEGGHYLAMKAVGYRNLHVFFVPGLGGLATGEKQDATTAQKVLVYLAGPVPGIALATAGLIALPAEVTLQFPWMSQLLMVALTINLINLLPVTPLDGGRVLEVLLFMRWPRLRVAFTAVSGLVLVAAGALLGETAMLVIGILVAAALPAQWRFSQLARAIHRAPGEALAEEPAARRVFTALAGTTFGKWTYQHRAIAADELIGQLRTPVPGVVGVGVGLALYAACFIAPLGAALVAWPGARNAVMDEETREMMAEVMAETQQAAATDSRPQRDWRAELEQAGQVPERRLMLLAEATEAGFILGEGSEQDLKASREEMRRIAEQLPAGNVARAYGLLAILEGGEAESDPPALRALMSELDGTTPDSAAARGRVGLALARRTDSSAERLQLLKESRDAMLQSGKPVGFYLDDAWGELAREYAKGGDPRAAEIEWRALLSRYAGSPQDPAVKGYAEIAYMGYSSLLIRQARFDDAEAFLRPLAEAAIAQGKRTALMRSSWQMEDLFWMALRKGDASQASKWLGAWSGAPRAKRDPQYALASLATAELMHDEKGLAHARSHIATLPGTSPVLCQSTLAKYDGTEIAAQRKALIARYEVCKGRSP